MNEHGRHIVWQSLATPGLEHVRARNEGDQIVAHGRTVRVLGGVLEDLRWRIECDLRWRTRAIRVLLRDRLHPLLYAQCDGQGRWTVQTGEVRGRLAGCVDVHLADTPFTSTLPIRRLGPWRPGEEVRIRVASANPVEGVFLPVRQSYTLESEEGDVRIFAYRNLDSGFEAKLSVDRSGFVIDYGSDFRRTWSG